MEGGAKSPAAHIGKSSQQNDHSPPGKGREEQQNPLPPNCWESEQRDQPSVFQEQQASRPNHGKSPHVGVPHNLQTALSSVAPKQPIANIHEAVQVQPPGYHHQENQQKGSSQVYREDLPGSSLHP